MQGYWDINTLFSCILDKERSEKKLLGFSFVHLMEADRTTIKDGSHSLCIYKCEDQEQLTDSSIYLPLVARLSEVRLSDQVTVHRGFVRSTKESITVKTRLCSTKLTQNVHLMSLLNWKSNPEQIQDTLKRIMLIVCSDRGFSRLGFYIEFVIFIFLGRGRDCQVSAGHSRCPVWDVHNRGRRFHGTFRFGVPSSSLYH